MFDENTVVDNQSTAQETTATEIVAPEQKAEAPKETLREMNMKTLRERAEAAERKVKDFERQMQERQGYSQPTESNKQLDKSADEEITIGDEELIEGKHLKKYISNVTKKYDRQLQEMKSQSAIDNAERALRAKYSDFDSVITEDNVNNFKALYPEEFSSVMSNTDPYARIKTAYTNIVNFGIAERTEGSPQTRDAVRRLEDNRTRPRAAAASPTTSGSDSPLARVGEFERRVLSDEMKELVRQRLAVSKDQLKYRRE